VKFEGPNLVSHEGLVQAASWWQRLGLPAVAATSSTLPELGGGEP